MPKSSIDILWTSWWILLPFVLLILAYTVKLGAARHFLCLPYKFLRAKIRKFTEKAGTRPSRSTRLCIFFPQRTCMTFRHDKKTCVCIFLFVQFLRLLLKPWQFFLPILVINTLLNYNKKTPQYGEFVVNCMFFGVDCIFRPNSSWSLRRKFRLRRWNHTSLRIYS